ncbi:MAG: amidohydrolase family protein [Gammaproteobacteria bacterium]|nr:amidohydrolase family protein [Gammaproteobacteria bacterium]
MSSDDPRYPACPGPDPSPRPPRFKVPAGACDTHFHVFGPEQRYPWSPARGYTPPDATVPMLQSLHRTLGISRGVVTQPSVYGTDNRASLDAVASAPQSMRAVVALPITVSDEELQSLHAAGARGVRVNMVDKGGMPFDDLHEVSEFCHRLTALGWHLEVLIHVDSFDDLRGTLGALPVDVVVGHLGYMSTALPLDNPGFQTFLELLAQGNFWAKLTGTYRITRCQRTPYDDVLPFARALIEAAPHKMLWGTDWPHPHHHGFMPNDGYLLDQLADWTDDDAGLIERILVDNPARLYGFQDQ